MNKFLRLETLLGGLFVAALVFASWFVISQQEFNADSARNQSENTAVANIDDKVEIEKIIRSYLLENPELMLEVQNALEKKQEVTRVAKQSAALVSMNDQIYKSKNQMIIGDPDAKVSVVEFFDYNCGYCKRAMADMDRIVSENPDVNFIMKEFPVLGEGSMQAHQVSLALAKLYPELYGNFHRALLSASGGKDGTKAMEVAMSLGADGDKLKTEMVKPELTEAIKEVYSIADGLGITGTPSYVIGDEVVFGAVGYNRLNPKVTNLKNCGKAIC